MIKNTNQMNEQQLDELKQLAEQCKQQEGSTPNLYTYILSQQRAFPASFLYYKQQALVGFISAYFFYDDAVELSLLVHPLYRKQGIAKQLLQSILPLVQLHHYARLIFSAPTNLNHSVFLSYGYAYSHSEYYMERSDLTPILDSSRNLTFTKATIKDIDTLCALDDLCFPEQHGDLLKRFEHILDNRKYELFVAYLHNTPIGKAHIRWESKGATLSDIAITPQQQGKGYGTALIAHCINQALSEGKPAINLDVETHNKRALDLYTRLGFTVHNACDYWTINQGQLASLIT
jgi:ribosomal protein S18 acetylase RimI-like enzyme